MIIYLLAHYPPCLNFSRSFGCTLHCGYSCTTSAKSWYQKKSFYTYPEFHNSHPLRIRCACPGFGSFAILIRSFIQLSVLVIRFLSHLLTKIMISWSLTSYWSILPRHVGSSITWSCAWTCYSYLCYLIDFFILRS